jgi:hypothetical protein
MKTFSKLMFSVLCLCILSGTYAMAQLPPMPPCCIWTPRVAIQGDVPALQSKIEAANQSLQAQSFTGSQLLPQIDDTFSPVEKTDLAVISNQVISIPIQNGNLNSNLMYAEETPYYRMPAPSMSMNN